jgi:hypothetical protein
MENEQVDLSYTSHHDGIRTFIRRDISGEKYLYATTWLKAVDWQLVVRQQEKDAFKELRTATYLILIIAILGGGIITGAGLPIPSIENITLRTRSDPERSRTLDAEYLWRFVNQKAPAVSDTWLKSDQYWNPGNAPDLGVYDISQPYNAPGQDPKLIVVHGDLQITGTLSGGGMLVVTGEFQ